MPFIQITDVSIINTDQIARIRFIPSSRTKAEYREDFGRKAEIPGTATTVSTSQLAIEFSKIHGDEADIKMHGDEADRVYAALLEHIQVHQLP